MVNRSSSFSHHDFVSQFFLFPVQAYFTFPVKNEALLTIAAIATIAKAIGAKILIIFLPLN